MHIRYGFQIGVVAAQPTVALARLDIHPERRGDIRDETAFTAVGATATAPYLDLHGNLTRRITVFPGEATLKLSGVIEDNGQPERQLTDEAATPVSSLPPETMVYLLGSRYCETDRLTEQAWQLFGHLSPGASQVKAILEFVHNRLQFGYAFARPTRTAVDAFNERVGVCRDFAHLTATLCRCVNIPARYVNGYLGDIGVPRDPAPMDFSAWVEVFVGGRWFTIDARHNTPRIGRIVIARGRDAVDVPLIHTFGQHTLKDFKVITDEVQGTPQAHAA